MGFGLAAALPELVALSIGRRQPCLGARDQPRLEVVETCDTLPVCRISRPASDPSPQRICLDDVFLVNLGQVCTIVHGPLPSLRMIELNLTSPEKELDWARQESNLVLSPG